jgi:hypothetical protein
MARDQINDDTRWDADGSTPDLFGGIFVKIPRPIWAGTNREKTTNS